MTVGIVKIPSDQGDPVYHATGHGKHAEGRTPGAALDALTARLGDVLAPTVVIIQHMRPDPYFTAAQQERLDTLMTRWRQARDQGDTLPADIQSELEQLVDAELAASAARAAGIADRLGQ